MAGSATVIVILMAGLLPSSDADGFLHPAKMVSREDVEHILESELASLAANMKGLESIEKELLHMYAALPKNEHGRLEPTTARYALDRYFTQKHSWRIIGLTAASGTWNSSSSQSMTANRVPAYIQSLFEKRLNGQGLDLRDLAAFAATLTDIIHKEVMGDLEVVYSAMGAPLNNPVEKNTWDKAVPLYLARYMNGTALSTLKEMEDNLDVWRHEYPHWLDTERWSVDSLSTQKFLETSRRNPFVESQPSFDESVVFLEGLGHEFGTFQNLECRRIKQELLDWEIGGTGRVALSNMYKNYFTEDGTTFTESAAYLEDVGALDHTDKNRVIIANYLSNPSNCMGGSSFYSVCCINECEDLLRHVEREIKAPSSPPARIASMVSGLASDTVHAPRNLSTALLNRLEEIAGLHDGRVPLHGRMFKQWMHHAFPRECPFPHAEGTKSTWTVDQWEATMGISADATDEEMMNVGEVRDMEVPLPWTEVEEMFAVHKRASVRESAPRTLTPLRALAGLALITSFAVPLAWGSEKLLASNPTKDHKFQSHLV